MHHQDWIIDIAGKHIARITSPRDRYAMNWVEGAQMWGTVRKPDALSYEVSRCFTERGTLEETYTFLNTTPFDVFVREGDICIAATFNDSYHASDICLTQRCHAHLWCGGKQSWVMALRMGGERPHLGLALTQGSLGSYSIERGMDGVCVSNDRGDFLLHPSAFELLPGETYTIRWELFWHDGKADFYHQLAKYPNHIEINAERFVLFKKEDAAVHSNATPAEMTIDTSVMGEQQVSFSMGDNETFASFFVLPEIETLQARRVQFIAQRQQYHNAASPLDGAYLLYDNETKRPYFSHEVNDHNGGRERLAMGAVVAQYLRRCKDETIEKSLDEYAAYVLRELFEENGVVFNDVHRNNDWHRLYNYPWTAILFMELYRLKKDALWLERAVKVMKEYYRCGGMAFYAIGIPMTELCALLLEAGLEMPEGEVRALFIEHARQIAKTGVHYPSSEVDYEQSIVAPAVDYLIMGYILSDDPSFLDAAREQMAVLELFGADQPDYHLNEVAIRHWDGYWFGKNRLLGDTFPHYWSSLSGLAFSRFAKLTGDARYAQKAERSLRGSLTMIFEDGSASCAMVFPRTVNGQRAHCFDPWANDQDWGLYYYVKHHMWPNEI